MRESAARTPGAPCKTIDQYVGATLATQETHSAIVQRYRKVSTRFSNVEIDCMQLGTKRSLAECPEQLLRPINPLNKLELMLLSCSYID